MVWRRLNILPKILRKIKFVFNSGVKLINKFIICVNRGWDPRLAFFCDMDLKKIPQTTHFDHPIGIVIHEDTIIGEDCDIKHCVTIGRKEGAHDNKRCPVIGSGVIIGSHAIILGEIKIGNNCRIGANAIVLEDIPSNTVYVSKFEPKYIPMEEI